MAIERTVHIHEATGATFESVFVGDAAAGTQPGVLLFPNFFGIKEWDYARAEVLATQGYKVLAVDLYGQGKRGTDMESASALMHELTQDRAVMRDRLLAALALLKTLPGVDAGRTAAIGFCLGGKCVLDLARAGADIKGGVSFHGVYDAPPFPNAAITAKLLVCHGWEDALCPPEATVGLAKELTEAGVDWQIHAYGHTGHGFTVEGNANFSESADRRSWKAASDFLAEVLGRRQHEGALSFES
jgi:dienelactone hydrolase